MKYYKRWIIAGAALTAAVVLLLCVAGVFRVREVTVTGNEYYTKEQIADFVIGGWAETEYAVSVCPLQLYGTSGDSVHRRI